MNPGPTDLRPEASPLPFFSLTAVQQEAYRRLASMLTRAADDVGQRPSGNTQPRLTDVDLDFHRKSRVAVVSGDRGTGKTSVVLSIIQDINQRQKPDFGSPPPDPSNLQERQTTQGEVESLFNRVVWLDMLDMSPLPAAANLFSAILVRIEEAVARRLPPELAKEKPRSYLDAPEVYDSPLEKLRRLQTDVAVSWEGNLKERAGALDANTFAAEVRRVEYVRLKVNARLTEVLDELAPAFGRRLGGDGNAIFVLPVDDFDLNPPRCLELLEMLRTLSVPRLFFLVLGDVDVAETMCGLQLAGAVAKVASPATADFLPIQLRDVQATIVNVAGNVIRKLLPPNQRIYLAPLKVKFAAELRPPGTKKDDPTIAGFLKQIPLQIPELSPAVQARLPAATGSADAPPTLYDLLFATTPASYGTLGPDPVFYQARKFLERPLRQLVDLWLTLEKTVTGTGPTEDRLRQFRKRLHFFCRDVLRAEETLPLDAGRRLRTAFDLDPDFNSVLSAEPLHLVPTLYPPRVEVFGAEPANSAIPQGEQLTWTVVVQGAAGWELRSNPEGTEPNALFLAPSTTYLLIFYSDLVTLFQEEAESNPLLDVRKIAWRFARMRYHFQGKTLQAQSWPFPNVLTLWEADRFINGWTKRVLRLRSWTTQSGAPPELIPNLVYHWIGLGTAALSGKPLEQVVDEPNVPEEAWQKLRQSVEGLYTLSLPSLRVGGAVRRWIVEVLSLLNPDVVGPNTTPKKVFRGSAVLVALCEREGKPFMEWKRQYLTTAKVLAEVDEAKFWAAMQRTKPWWKD